jgi:predicted lipoprotein with Yx(FWY)xxD motif
MRRVLPVLAAAFALAAVTATAAQSGSSTGVTVKATYSKALKATIIVTSTGLTLYEYVADNTHNQTPYPACINDPTYHCVKLWPPLMTSGRPKAGEGVKSNLLGTVVRTDNGKMQVTYAGHPLYRYAGGISGPPDTKPGDVYGQAALGIWYVLSPSGRVIKTQR